MPFCLLSINDIHVSSAQWFGSLSIKTDSLNSGRISDLNRTDSKAFRTTSKPYGTDSNMNGIASYSKRNGS